MENKYWDFLKPLLRPARFAVLLIALYFLSNLTLIELIATLDKTSLAETSSIFNYITKKITFLQLLGAILFAFLINPMLMAVVSKIIRKLLQPHTLGLQNKLYNIRLASEHNQLQVEDRLMLFNKYSANKLKFIVLREFLELIIPLSYCLFAISSRSFGYVLLSLIFGFLLSYLCVQKLLIYYLRYIAPYELIKPSK